MAFNANSVMSELTENNSVQNSELPVSAGVITVDSDLRDSVSGVPPQDSDGGDVDTHVTASQLMHMFADFEERMTRKLSCEMSRLVSHEKSYRPDGLLYLYTGSIGASFKYLEFLVSVRSENVLGEYN